MHEEGIKMIQKIEPVSIPEIILHVESSVGVQYCLYILDNFL